MEALTCTHRAATHCLREHVLSDWPVVVSQNYYHRNWQQSL